jgi:hypothetical protein
VPLGLPFGPKPRLVLIHLDTEAIRTGSPVVPVEDSLTAFVRGLLRYAPNGFEIRQFKDQLGALAAASIRIGFAKSKERATTINTQIVHGFDVWLPEDRQLRIMWPMAVVLSREYFESLKDHAVPLDERAVAALATSCMGLDVYCWLAQRLHRVPSGRPLLVPWPALKAQFGWHYDRMEHFRERMRQVLVEVCTQYPDAWLDLDHRGLLLRHSPPPIRPKTVTVFKPQDAASEAPGEISGGPSGDVSAVDDGGHAPALSQGRSSPLLADVCAGGRPWLTSAFGPAEAARPPRYASPADALRRLARRVARGPSASASRAAACHEERETEPGLDPTFVSPGATSGVAVGLGNEHGGRNCSLQWGLRQQPMSRQIRTAGAQPPPNCSKRLFRAVPRRRRLAPCAARRPTPSAS